MLFIMSSFVMIIVKSASNLVIWMYVH